eukprot:TRINITY_DN23276_c0_g1_i3.p1 TRINITY_DN23276_c0_g1~~TRINITY_DN23276_c0_g1_i3.p1  ORF type:complete len:668 (+),score=112.10 TRINITY_DN23276_c0_g1_i3:62-2065(+)
MEHLSGAPLVYVCILLVAAALHTCGLAVNLLPKLEQAWQTWQMWRRARSVGQCASCPASGEKPPVKDAALQLVLEGRVRERRVFYARRYLYYLNLFIFGALMSSAFNIIMAKPRWLSSTQDYAALVTYLVGLVVYYVADFEGTPNPGGQSDRIVFSLFLLHHAVVLAFIAGASREYVLHTVLVGAPMLHGSSAVMMEPKLISIVAFGYVAVTSYKLDNAAFMINWALELYLHFYILASSLGITYLTRTWTLIHVHQTAAAHNWRTERLAAEGLLNLLCDCVLELDSDLHIVMESAKFASMVLVRDSIAGRRLDEFLLGSSRNKLYEVLRGNSLSVAGAMNMDMMDSLRNTIKIEMFYIQFSDIQASQERYLVGLREYGDVSCIIRQPQAAGAEPQAADEQPTAQHAELSSSSSALRPISEVAIRVAASKLPPSDEELRSQHQPRERQEQVVYPAGDESADDEHVVDDRRKREEDVVRNRAGDVDATRVHDLIMRLGGGTNCQKQPKFRFSAEVASAREAPEAAMRATKQEAMAATLLQLIKSWSAAEAAFLTKGACCVYHASLGAAKRVLEKEQAKPCDQQFGRTTKWQCVDCGVLHEEELPQDNDCVVCKLCNEAASQPAALQQLEGGAEKAETVEASGPSSSASAWAQSSLYSKMGLLTERRLSL